MHLEVPLARPWPVLLVCLNWNLSWTWRCSWTIARCAACHRWWSVLHRCPVFSAMPSGKKSTPYNAFIDTLRSIKCYLHEDPEVLEVTLPKIIYMERPQDFSVLGKYSAFRDRSGHRSRQDDVEKHQRALWLMLICKLNSWCQYW